MRRASRPTATLATAILLGIGWCVLVATAIDTALPFSPLRPMEQPSAAARMLAPQGWGFFTRDPHEPALGAYVRGPDGWRDASPGPNAEPAQLFGWQRASRAQGVETGTLLFAHGRMDFAACESDLPTCLERAEVVGAVSNPLADPTLCGDVALVRLYSVPWAWARSMSASRAPVELLRLEVAC